MKTANVLASVLFGSLAAAAPFKRDLVTKTDVVVETVVVYTTVWDGTAVTTTAQATTTSAAGFYEAPKVTSTVVATSAPAPAAPAKQEPSSSSTEAAYTPAPVTSAAPVETSAPAPSSTTVEAAAATSATASSTSGGESYTGSLTENPYGGALGACGEAIQDTDMVVALGADGFGASTYNSQTGEATNAWCGQSINIVYNGGDPVTAKIMDKCPGCSEWGLDATDAVWKALAGDAAYDRFEVTWTVA